MNASIIVIGTELTRGIIHDSNGPLIARELTHLGVHISQVVSLPDDGTIKSVLGALMKEADVVVITGGLGPTSDDLTRSVIAEAAGKVLVQDSSSWKFLLGKLGEKAYGANARQAMIMVQLLASMAMVEIHCLFPFPVLQERWNRCSMKA